jgi:hypothetical protein
LRLGHRPSTLYCVAKRRTGGNFDTPADVRCEYCQERIGVYEPMVELTGDLATRTSRAADPRFDSVGASRLFHGACYDERISQPKP